MASCINSFWHAVFHAVVTASFSCSCPSSLIAVGNFLGTDFLLLFVPALCNMRMGFLSLTNMSSLILPNTLGVACTNQRWLFA